MTKYIIRITVAEELQNNTASKALTTCIYCVECSDMAEALRKAERYAFFQLDEEKADYISHVDVEMVEA